MHMLPTETPERADIANIADSSDNPERILLPLLSIRGLSKAYGSATVVDDIHLTISHGSIHALLGQNGAGKSTLIQMLAGVIPTDAGHIEIDGVRRRARSVREAHKLGIVALPQELTLVPTLSAPENIFLGQKQPGSFGRVSRRGIEQDAAVQFARLGQRIPLRTPVGELSAVQQTMVALARALSRDARLLILDEPTAGLTIGETEQLFTVLHSLRAAGTSIIYVSHRLDEVFRLADTMTVMRDGSRVWTKPVGDTNPDDVIAAMIGRAGHEVFPSRAATAEAANLPAEQPRAETLKVEALRGRRLQGVSLTACAGRILGIAGLAGSGRSELLRLIAGDERMRGGTITLDGTLDAPPVAGGSPTRADAPGIALISDVYGGDQLKIELAKHVERQPRVLLLDEPTRGIDVGTKTEIYAMVRRLADAGVAVIVVSSEIPELLGLTDEIAVLSEGRLGALLPAATADEASIRHHCYRKAV